jgi:hypothetical protein
MCVGEEDGCRREEVVVFIEAKNSWGSRSPPELLAIEYGMFDSFFFSFSLICCCPLLGSYCIRSKHCFYSLSPRDLNANFRFCWSYVGRCEGGVE